MFNTENKSSNVVWHQATVTRARREEQNGHLDILVNNAGIRIEEYGKQPSE